MAIHQLLLSTVIIPRISIFLTTTGAGNWIVPDNWNPNDNSIEVIGGGGAGAAAGATNYAGSGSGGAYSKIVNQTLTPGDSIPYNVGPGGSSVSNASTGVAGPAGQDTWFGHATYASSLVGAKGGVGGILFPNTLSASTINGGQASDGIGTVKFSGGAVGPGLLGGNLTGGGGAAGPDGDGDDGVQTAGVVGLRGCDGGQGGNSSGGVGGIGSGTGSTGGNGGDGLEFDPHGSGGGGGSCAPSSGTATGGNGGRHGGGGGGGSASGFATGISGKGGDGIIVITYTPSYAKLLPVLEYLGTGSNQVQGSAGTVTFNSIPFGTATVDRLIIVCIHSAGSGNPTISNCTIGGITATAVTVQATGSNTNIRLYQAVVPTGTSGTVTYDLSAASPQNNIGVWSIKNLLSVSPVATSVVNGSTTSSRTITLSDILNNGVAIFGAETTSATTFDNGVTTRYSSSSFDNSGGDMVSVANMVRFQTAISSRAVAAASWR